MEANAGAAAQFSNKDYEAAGARVATAKDAFESDIVLKVLIFYCAFSSAAVRNVYHVFLCLKNVL